MPIIDGFTLSPRLKQSDFPILLVFSILTIFTSEAPYSDYFANRSSAILFEAQGTCFNKKLIGIASEPTPIQMSHC